MLWHSDNRPCTSAGTSTTGCSSSLTINAAHKFASFTSSTKSLDACEIANAREHNYEAESF